MQTIQGHLIGYVARHILSVEGVFNAEGYLDIEQTFAPMQQRLPEGVQGDYNLSVLTSVFSGVRVLRDCCQNWLGSRQLKNFGDHVRLLSNQFYELNPEILRTGTIQDEGIVSDLDRPSKMLYVGSDKIFAGIQQSQQQFVNNDREKAIKLQQKIWSMKKRMLQYDSVFCRQFQFIVPQVQESLGTAFAGPLQYFNVNFTHSPVARGVYPSRVPCLGTDCQPHSTKCPSEFCCMSITMRFGDVSASEWGTMLAMRGEL